jgi:hypothetical protein
MNVLYTFLPCICFNAEWKMPTQEELLALLAEPSESLAIEHKSWLELGDRRNQAIVAKAAIALANHGGGMVVFGMRGDADGDLQSHVRPENIARYRQDDLNALINRYADPQLHCALQFSIHPASGVEHAFLIVQGGERVPIMSRRDSDGVIQAQRCYIRKPGPKSEEPFTAAEWRALLDRCIRSGRDELLDSIRLIVEGRVGEAPAQDAIEALTAFADDAVGRWEALIDALPPEDPGRMLHGRYELSFELDGIPALTSMVELRRLLEEAGQVRHTGWGPFVSINRRELAPHIVDNAIQAWLGVPEPDRYQRTPNHCDFWRVNQQARFFLMRGFDEDGGDAREPGHLFDITLPVWRVGEAMLYVARFASALDTNPAVTVRCRYVGLRGRTLTSWDGRRLLMDGYRALDDEVTLSARATAREFDEHLVEVLHPMLVPLYERFDFFELPTSLVAEELARMRANRF